MLLSEIEVRLTRCTVTEDVQNERIAAALRLASDTRALRIGSGAIAETGRVFENCFGSRTAVLIADTNTFRAAGEQVARALKRSGIAMGEPVLFSDPDLHAYHEHVEELQAQLGSGGTIPVAVGSGTINDLTKLAAHRCGVPYIAVATAASMDGYTAYGASITHEGSKQTFDCPAPAAVIADMDVICRAPRDMNAAGYADLVAKVTAGADWILADALGIEAIDLQAWSLVQSPLRQWVSDPDGVRAGKRAAIEGLMEGLLMTGFAMQWSRSSRPASGAEHQFSHLWDMQGHRHDGHIPHHGCKVAIGTLASTLLYEQLLSERLERLDIQAALAAWPEPEAIDALVERSHSAADLKAVARKESRAKYLSRDALAQLLERLQGAWPGLRERLRQQLIPSRALRQMLSAAGAPTRPEEIGLDAQRLRESYVAAQQIRRRFTVLDLAFMTGLLPLCLDRLFDEGGPWSCGPDGGGTA